MSLVTVSAIVKSDASFAVGPYGLPSKKSLSISQTPTTGIYQIIYNNIFEHTPVITATPAWLGQNGPVGGLTLDNLVIDQITPSHATVKTGNSFGNGDWRPFTIVLTGPLRTSKEPREDV